MHSIEEILFQKSLAILLDPENLQSRDAVARIGKELRLHRPNLVLIGGSTWYESTTPLIRQLREFTGPKGADNSIPLVLFPGHPKQFSPEADAILFHSLLTSDKAETLIGWQTDAARPVKEAGIEVISMGYILVDGGRQSTTARVTNTKALPVADTTRIEDTAIAGELLGMQSIYLEAGSGADNAVSSTLIKAVRSRIGVPLIVGGGIRSREAIEAAWQAGANLVVVGNWIQEHPEDLGKLVEKR